MSEGAKIRIVQVTTVPQTLGFFGDHIDYLKDRGYEVHLVSSPGDKGLRLAEEKGLPFHAVPMSRTITPAADLRSLLALRRIFKELKPDIVHSHTPKAGLLGTIAARMAGVNVVFLSIFGLPQMTLKGLKRFLLDTLTWVSCHLAHRVWIDSPSMRDHVVGRGLCPAAKAVTIGNGSVNGVDALGAFSPEKRDREEGRLLRERMGISPDALVVGFVGRIVRDKGMHELAVAWRILKPMYPALRLLIVGDLEEKDPILPEDRQLLTSDPDVIMPGFSTDIPAYMAVMDIFVMPSHREGFGVTNIEAAAMGLPVVSTAIPGCVDSVKNGETGVLVPAGDGARLAEAIRAYLDDPLLRRAHGDAGRKRVLEEFRPEGIWRGLYEEYRAFTDRNGVFRTDCPACRGTGTKKLKRRVGADRFLACPDCGFQFIHPYIEPGSAFDDYAWTKEYTEHFDCYARPVIESLRIKIADVERIMGRKPDSLLDIGCGNGLYLHAANVLDLKNLGTDVDRVNVEFARGKGLNAVAAAVEDLNLPDRYDFVHLKAVLHLVPDPPRLLAKARALLAPGGVMYVDVPDQGSLFTKLRILRVRGSYGQLQPPLRRGAYTMRALRNICEAAGLRVVRRVFPYPGDPAYYPLDNPRAHQIVFALFSKARISSMLGVYLVAEEKGRGDAR
jgi:glycosyltransferase involved in cell wall biosynthesis/SAM-dependent methyltransferase